MNISIVPVKFRRDKNAQLPAPILDLTGKGLPTEHPVGAYIATQEARSSKLSMLDRLAAALCATNERERLKDVGFDTASYYREQVWRVNWAETSSEWMLALCHWLHEVGYSVSTRRMTLSAVNGVLTACRVKGLMSWEEYFKATDNLPKIRGNSIPSGREVRPDEIAAMYHVFNEDPKHARGLRDAAIFSLGLYCALRGCEVIRLTTSDYSEPTETLLVHGKGNKGAEVPIMGLGKADLDAWLDVRGPTPGGIFTQLDAAGNVMILDRKTGKRRLKPLRRPDAINRMLRHRIAEAGLIEPFTFHDLRRTASTDLSRTQDLRLHKSCCVMPALKPPIATEC